MGSVVIVGTGMAGYTLAREFRKLDADSELTIISRDGGESYSKPMLSNALGLGKSADALANQDAAHMAAQLNARILTRCEVNAVDTGGKTLGTDVASTGVQEDIVYDKLVLAVGADPIRLQLGGDAADEALSINDLDDYRGFRERLPEAGRVLIMGGGLIGCEFANDLARSGFRPVVVDPMGWPLASLVPVANGDALRDALAALGTEWRLGQTVASIGRDGDGYCCTLSGGESERVDLVVSAIGLRPRTGLAESAGLACARGIKVDRMLASSAEGVYALGDCAEVNGLVLPFVMPLMQSARALAATLAGQATEVSYPPMPVMAKTPALPTVVSPPAPGIEGDWQSDADVAVSGDVAIVSRFVGSDGALLGFALSGEATKQKAALARELPAMF